MNEYLHFLLFPFPNYYFRTIIQYFPKATYIFIGNMHKISKNDAITMFLTFIKDDSC